MNLKINLERLNGIKIGYACLLSGDYKFNHQVNRRLTVKKASTMTSEEIYNKVKELTRLNFDGLYNVILFNAKKNIKMYRVSSDMIVLDNHELNTYDWMQDQFISDICSKIRNIAQENDIRLSMHPNHYNVIATTKEDVFQKTLINLQSEYNVATALGADILCIHVGSKQVGIDESKQRFIDNFNRLPKYLQNIIAIENDDKSFSVENTLDICESLGISMILDIHHNTCLTSSKPLHTYMTRIYNTWNGKVPKIHISSGKTDYNDKSHADYIDLCDLEIALKLTDYKFDIMIESKKKELALFKLLDEIKTKYSN